MFLPFIKNGQVSNRKIKNSDKNETTTYIIYKNIMLDDWNRRVNYHLQILAKHEFPSNFQYISDSVDAYNNGSYEKVYPPYDATDKTKYPYRCLVLCPSWIQHRSKVDYNMLDPEWTARRLLSPINIIAMKHRFTPSQIRIPLRMEDLKELTRKLFPSIISDLFNQSPYFFQLIYEFSWKK